MSGTPPLIRLPPTFLQLPGSCLCRIRDGGINETRDRMQPKASWHKWRNTMLPSISRRHWLLASSAGFLGGFAHIQNPGAESADLITSDEWVRRRASEAPLAMRFLGRTAEECRR